MIKSKYSSNSEGNSMTNKGEVINDGKEGLQNSRVGGGGERGN